MAKPDSSLIAGPLEFRRLRPELQESVASFFGLMSSDQDSNYFHPHPMTTEQAVSLCSYAGKDLYYVACAGTTVLAYGMLRGWDEGYEIPSLGIAVHPQARGTGVARAFMAFLHLAAKLRGATKVRLTVYAENIRAVEIYRRLGYILEHKNEREYVGTIAL